MSMQDLAAALKRVQTALQDGTKAGLRDDPPATARWQGGTRVATGHADGTQVATDMPTRLGGSGDLMTPGWLFRASVASCAATSIALAAVADGIELATLEVQVDSRSDLRGLLGMPDGDGNAVYAGPSDMRLSVRIGAPGVAPERLRAAVEAALGRSPVPGAVRSATALPLSIQFA